MSNVQILESNNRLNLSNQLSNALNNGWTINGQLIITPYKDKDNDETLFWYSILIIKND